MPTHASVAAFVASHSVALSLSGGLLLGAGAYYLYNKRQQEKANAPVETTETVEAAEAAA